MKSTTRKSTVLKDHDEAYDPEKVAIEIRAPAPDCFPQMYKGRVSKTVRVGFSKPHVYVFKTIHAWFLKAYEEALVWFSEPYT